MLKRAVTIIKNWYALDAYSSNILIAIISAFIELIIFSITFTINRTGAIVILSITLTCIIDTLIRLSIE